MLNSANVAIQTRHKQTGNILLSAFLLLYVLVFVVKLPKFIFTGQTPLLLQAVVYGILGVCSILLFRHELMVSLKSWRSSALKNILWVVGVFVANTFITNIAVYPAYAAGYEDLSNTTGVMLMMQAIGKPLTILVVGFAAPVVEECVYRAFLIRKVKTKIPLWVCVLLSSLLFGLAHLQGLSPLHFLGVLPPFASGLVFGTVYAITGNITLPILMHIINNTVGTTFSA